MLRKNMFEGNRKYGGGCSSLNLGCWPIIFCLPPVHQQWGSQGRLIREGGGGVCDGDSQVLCNLHTVHSALCNLLTVHSALCNLHTVVHSAVCNLHTIDIVESTAVCNWDFWILCNLYTVFIVDCSRQSTAVCDKDFWVSGQPATGWLYTVVDIHCTHQSTHSVRAVFTSNRGGGYNRPSTSIGVSMTVRLTE